MNKYKLEEISYNQNAPEVQKEKESIFGEKRLTKNEAFAFLEGIFFFFIVWFVSLVNNSDKKTKKMRV